MVIESGEEKNELGTGCSGGVIEIEDEKLSLPHLHAKDICVAGSTIKAELIKGKQLPAITHLR